MSSSSVLCAGLSCVDHIWQVSEFPPRASRTTATGYRIQGGGPAATAAFTVARLGGRAHLWARHGDDPGGRFAIDELERVGVDTGGVQVVPGGVSWVSSVLVAPDGERYIFPYRGDGLAVRLPDPAALPPGIGSLLVDFRQPDLCEAALAWAGERGVPAIGDLSDTAHWPLSERLDVIIASEECARELLGRRDPEAALQAMRWRPQQQVGITLGADGYLYDAGRGLRHLPALPVEVVDTTGAGDVFHGAYALALAGGRHADECALFASVAAALSCTGVGRSAVPSGAEVETLMKRSGAGRARGPA